MNYRKSKRIVMKSPATRRFAQQVTQKDLTIRFLTMKLVHINERLMHMTDVKSPNQRLIEIHKLHKEVSNIIRELDAPRHNMSFYKRRTYIV